jgi:hypothetical protein
MWKEKEYIELLESMGIDTCCFMGSGYHFPDYKVGQEFYFPYAYYGYLAKQENPEAFEAVKNMMKGNNIEVTDRWKLIQRYKYEVNKIWDGQQRNDKILIQNLRTKEIKELRFLEDIEKFYYCLMAEQI